MLPVTKRMMSIYAMSVKTLLQLLLSPLRLSIKMLLMGELEVIPGDINQVDVWVSDNFGIAVGNRIP